MTHTMSTIHHHCSMVFKVSKKQIGSPLLVYFKSSLHLVNHHMCEESLYTKRANHDM